MRRQCQQCVLNMLLTTLGITPIEMQAHAAKPLSASSAIKRLIAKYAYAANMNSPLGKNVEIDLCQCDKMIMTEVHAYEEFSLLWSSESSSTPTYPRIVLNLLLSNTLSFVEVG